MVLHQFPNLQWLKTQASARFANRQGVGGIQLNYTGWPTVVLNTKAKNVFRDNIQGPLSIFSNLSGKSEVLVEKKKVTVTPETFFISNTGQPYTLELKEQPAETFNIHFGEHFVERALQSISSTPADLLENNVGQHVKDFGFYNRLVPASSEFQSIIEALRTNGTDSLFLDEKLFQLLALLIQEEKGRASVQEKLRVAKAATQEEILRRLTTVTDYLYTYYTHNPGLDELARISCLSKFHFLRLFKMAYGQSPHQFIMALKVKRAKVLLRQSIVEVKSIAQELGFDDASAFSRLFHNQTGVYPSKFRSNS